jgi:hypothetical protein
VSIILRITHIYIYILVPKGNLHSYISKCFISPTFGDFLNYLKSLCVFIHKNNMSHELVSYIVIFAHVHHQEIKDYLFESSLNVLRHVLKYYSIYGKQSK